MIYLEFDFILLCMIYHFLESVLLFHSSLILQLDVGVHYLGLCDK